MSRQKLKQVASDNNATIAAHVRFLESNKYIILAKQYSWLSLDIVKKWRTHVYPGRGVQL